MRRKPGEGSPEEHPKGSGKWRLRSRVNGRLIIHVSGVSHAEALEVADAQQLIRSESDMRQGVTLAQFGLGFIERRRRAGIRAVEHDRTQWLKHVACDPIGGMPVATIDRRDLVDWLDRRTHLAHRTRLKLRNLLRTALGEAVERGLLPSNPALELRVHRAGAARATDDLEGILQPEEQSALLNVVPPLERPAVMFALFSGVRQGEQWWLKWDDVGDGNVTICRSTGGLPPKGGRPRTVELLSPALTALREMYAQVRSVGKRKPRVFAVRDGQWVFPAPRGTRRQEGECPRDWHRWLRAAGITRRVRWHDLRHTCATSLLAGWWGRKWSLDEVCKLLGHSSIALTERYARKLNETLRAAVKATPILQFPFGNETGEKAAFPGAFTDKSPAFLKPRSEVRNFSGALEKTAAVLIGGDRVGELAGNSSAGELPPGSGSAKPPGSTWPGGALAGSMPATGTTPDRFGPPSVEAQGPEPDHATAGSDGGDSGRAGAGGDGSVPHGSSKLPAPSVTGRPLGHPIPVASEYGRHALELANAGHLRCVERFEGGNP